MTKLTQIYLFLFNGSQRLLLLICLLSALSISSVIILEPLLQKSLIDEGLLKADKDLVIQICAFMFGIGTLFMLITYCRTLLAKKLSNQVLKDRSLVVNERMLNSNIQTHLDTDQGFFHSRIVKDTPDLVESGIGFFLELFQSVFGLLVAIGFCLYISWELTLATIAICPILYFLGYLLLNKIESVAKIELDCFSIYQNTIARAIDSLISIKQLGINRLVLGTIESELDSLNQASYKKTELTSRLNQGSRLLIGLSEALFMTAAGLAVCFGNLSVGEFFAFSSVFWKIIPSIKNLSSLGSSLANIRVLFARFHEIEEPDGSSKNLTKNGAIVSLESASLDYGEKNIVKNASLDIWPQQHIFLSGENGSGKSTLAAAICGYKSIDQGKLSVGYYKTISSQLNPPKFFKTNLVDVIHGLSDSQFDKDILLEMLSDFGLGKKLGIDPSLLSDGQKKKSALALCLAKNADLYVLDEPFASLDERSKSVVGQWIDNRTKHKSTLIILHGEHHRLGAADRHLKIEDGYLIGENNHEGITEESIGQ